MKTPDIPKEAGLGPAPGAHIEAFAVDARAAIGVSTAENTVERNSDMSSKLWGGLSTGCLDAHPSDHRTNTCFYQFQS